MRPPPSYLEPTIPPNNETSPCFLQIFHPHCGHYCPSKSFLFVDLVTFLVGEMHGFFVWFHCMYVPSAPGKAIMGVFSHRRSKWGTRFPLLSNTFACQCVCAGNPIDNVTCIAELHVRLVTCIATMKYYLGILQV